MKIYNIEEHLSCYCYDKDEKPMVEIRKVKNMAMGEILFSCNEIVFVLEGRLRLSLRNNPDGELRSGQIVFLPAGDKLHYKALTRCRLLIFRLEDSIHLCHTFGLERLNSIINEVDKPETLVPLEMNDRLQHFAQGMIDTMGDGLRCRIYLQARINSLLIMLRAYYPVEQLCLFFAPILSPDTLFSEQVRSNYLKYRTVNDLAMAMNMTPQQFTRRFNNVFGQPPYEWMQQEKARLIHGEICRSNKPFKEIANRYGFTVQANFNRFCQTAFAMSPGEIRKKRL